MIFNGNRNQRNSGLRDKSSFAHGRPGINPALQTKKFSNPLDGLSVELHSWTKYDLVAALLNERRRW
jgi:hypothetical protein